MWARSRSHEAAVAFSSRPPGMLPNSLFVNLPFAAISHLLLVPLGRPGLDLRLAVALLKEVPKFLVLHLADNMLGDVSRIPALTFKTLDKTQCLSLGQFVENARRPAAG